MNSEDKTASQQIDDIISRLDDWRGATLSNLRSIINRSNPSITEEVKWKKPSKPEGVPVWTRNGNVCIADVLKSAVRLTFPKGAQVRDPKSLFNTRLDSKSVRAIDFFKETVIDEKGLSQIIAEAIMLNHQ